MLRERPVVHNNDSQLNVLAIEMTSGLENCTSEEGYGKVCPVKTQRAKQRCALADYR